MDNHGRTHDPGVARDDDAVASAPRGLDPRRLLAGAVAGTAALLLPHSAAAGWTRGVRFAIENKQQWDPVPLNFYVLNANGQSPTWELREQVTLETGTSATFQTRQGNSAETTAELILYATAPPAWVYTILAKNPDVGTPWVEITFNPGDPNSEKKRWDLKPDQEEIFISPRTPGNPRNKDLILVTRRKDSDDYKEFFLKLMTNLAPDPWREGEIRPVGDKQDKNDKKDNNKRRRQRGGGGGLNDADQREHPVDRLLS